MEAKVDIKPYHSDIDALKLNHRLKQLEVSSSIHQIAEEQKISFAQLKLEVHALAWWESHTNTIMLEGAPLVTKWEEFKTLIKSQFYPIGYVENRWIQWHYFKKNSSQSMQEYTIEFIKLAIMLGTSPKNPNILLKYLGGLHCHLWDKVMLFKPKSIDETYL